MDKIVTGSVRLGDQIIFFFFGVGTDIKLILNQIRGAKKKYIESMIFLKSHESGQGDLMSNQLLSYNIFLLFSYILCLNLFL